jgi:hypothetical protein
MKRIALMLLIAFLLISAAGCLDGSHTGKIYIRKGNGKILKYYEVELDRPMAMSVTTEDGTIVEVDSRTTGLIESLSMNLGLSKIDGVDPTGYYGEY